MEKRKNTFQASTQRNVLAVVLIMLGIVLLGFGVLPDAAGSITWVIGNTVGAAGEVIGSIAGGIGHVVGEVAGGFGRLVGEIAGGFGRLIGAIFGGIGSLIGAVFSGGFWPLLLIVFGFALILRRPAQNAKSKNDAYSADKEKA